MTFGAIALLATASCMAEETSKLAACSCHPYLVPVARGLMNRTCYTTLRAPVLPAHCVDQS